MATLKTDDNTQFARVTLDGEDPSGTKNNNWGTAPLADNESRLIVNPLVNGQFIDSDLQRYQTIGAPVWALITNQAARIYQAFGSYNLGGTVWIQIFDAAATPPAGNPHLSSLPVASGQMWSYTLPPEGYLFNNGIVVAYSSTHTSFTASATGGMMTVFYRDQ